MSQYTLENFKSRQYDAASYELQFVFLWLVGNQITLEDFEWYISELQNESYNRGHDAGWGDGYHEGIREDN